MKRRGLNRKRLVKQKVATVGMSMLLAVQLVLGSGCTAWASGTEDIDTADSTIDILDADFSGNFWNDGIWSVNVSDWTGTEIDIKSYS